MHCFGCILRYRVAVSRETRPIGLNVFQNWSSDFQFIKSVYLSNRTFNDASMRKRTAPHCTDPCSRLLA